MALLDLKTPTNVKAVVLSVPKAVRLDALRGANPALHAEIERVSATPRRSRELNAETVEELILWMENPEAISAIVAGDPREAVSSAARRRLNELDAPPPPSANSKNMTIRTQRALDKADPASELAGLGRDVIDWVLVGEWFAQLPLHRREGLASSLYQLAHFDHESDTARNFAVELIVRSFQNLDQREPVQYAHLAQKRNVGILALGKLTGGLTLQVAELMVRGNYVGEFIEPQPVAPEAISFLLQENRLDILARCEAVEPEVIAKALKSGVDDNRRLAILLEHCRSPRYVDAITPFIKVINRDIERASRALAVNGISKASRAALLRCANAYTVCDVLAGTKGDAMDLDELEDFAKADPQQRLASTREIVLTCMRIDSPTPQFEAAVLAMWQYSEEMLTTVMNASWHSNWVHEVCMKATAEAFHDMPNAWGVFFNAARSSGAGSAGDLMKAVALIASNHSE
jgi:hypothetical protein